MRALIVAIVLAGSIGIGSADPLVHVTAMSAKVDASRVRAQLTRELASHNTFDVAVSESTIAVSRRRIEITVELRLAVSDRNGKIVSFVRATASAHGAQRAAAALREQATASAISAAIERLRSARQV